MNLADFFHLEAVNVPVDGFDEKTETFDVFLSKVFADYVATLKDLDDQQFPEICSKVRASSGLTGQLCNQIVSGLRSYLSGHPSNAFQCIERVLHTAGVMDLTTWLGPDTIETVPEQPPYGPTKEEIEAALNPLLYRMRTGAPVTFRWRRIC
jgi:hypothetical protein